MSAFDAEALLRSLRPAPGVYQMLDADGEALYIGKARDLRRRVASYFRRGNLNARVMAMLARVRDVQVTITAGETEALLLEQNLIKAHRPPYNVLLRDDKSYPSIRLSGETFPRLSMHRGARRRGSEYFGPYPNTTAVRESLHFLHRVFKLRQCENGVFKNRSRPCLQYQIKRCSAPCVGYIAEEEYAASVADARRFLQGDSRALLDELARRMEAASARRDYESAGVARDQIIALNRMQERQCIEGERGDIDIVACAAADEVACVHALHVRKGRVLGSRSHFLPLPLAQSEGEILRAFLGAHYLKGASDPPSRIILSHALDDARPLAEALGERAGRKVGVGVGARGARARWLELASQAARQNLQARQTGAGRVREQREALRELLGMDEAPGRLECFDISHQSGRETVASCVVFDENGPAKSDYRRFNIRDVKPGDDYAALRQALLRRYRRVVAGEGKLPEVLFIDGGAGQLAQAEKVWGELGLPDDVKLIGVAKGERRRPGRETLFVSGGRALRPGGDSPALHLVQRVRDEAHRFALLGHRRRREARTRDTRLNDIPGVGPKRRRELLRFFGSVAEIRRASARDIARVPGLSLRLAEQVRAGLNDDGEAARR